MTEDFLLPDPPAILQEALARYRPVFAFTAEAIALGHAAMERQLEYAKTLVPGAPCTRRARTDVNDNVCRFHRSITGPLIADGTIKEIISADGGDVTVLPDGFRFRIKKAKPSGATSNYLTGAIRRMCAASHRALFSAATPLDEAIQDGVMFDFIYVASPIFSDYEFVGLRFAATKYSPFLQFDRRADAELLTISPAALEVVIEARNRIAT